LVVLSQSRKLATIRLVDLRVLLPIVRTVVGGVVGVSIGVVGAYYLDLVL